MDEDSQKVQTSNYELNKFWGGHVLHGDYRQSCIAYLKAAKREDLKGENFCISVR